MKITVYLLEKHGYQTTYTTYKYIYIYITCSVCAQLTTQQKCPLLLKAINLGKVQAASKEPGYEVEKL